MSIFKTLCASLLAFGLSTQAFALNANEENDFSKLHMLYLVGVDAANLGKAKACNAKVKAFASQMGANYANADVKLKLFAQKNNYSLGVPEFTSTEQAGISKLQADLARIREIEGCSFDNLYLQVVRDGHAFAIKIATGIVAAQTNQETRGFMNSALNGLKNTHSDAVRLLQSNR